MALSNPVMGRWTIRAGLEQKLILTKCGDWANAWQVHSGIIGCIQWMLIICLLHFPLCKTRKFDRKEIPDITELCAYNQHCDSTTISQVNDGILFVILFIIWLRCGVFYNPAVYKESFVISMVIVWTALSISGSTANSHLSEAYCHASSGQFFSNLFIWEASLIASGQIPTITRNVLTGQPYLWEGPLYYIWRSKIEYYVGWINVVI